MGTSEYYRKIKNAYKKLPDGDAIQAHAGVFVENISMNRDITSTVDGGYNCDYTMNTGVTTVRGNITITSGIVTIGNVSLE